MNNGLIAVILMDCIAAIPSFGWSRVRAFITKVEKAKKTPATSPQPSAENSFNAKSKLLVVVIKPPVDYRHLRYRKAIFKRHCLA
ncbi:hypothetical protein LC607_21120 [Nostoc sp. CHAB 5824]|nr:hypothetical protein [Nostoc sp. CHAB 5824]